MQRESDKQGTAQDEHLRKETTNLIRGSGTGRAEHGGAGADAAAQPSRPARGMSPADVARRAELSRHLPPGEFPADRRHLLAHLRSKGAPDSVVEAISGLPEGKEFRTIGEVVREIGLTARH
ncbi:DUF2795 domain-containing protein [Actinoallomurus purpureus]|uniref:DUF2795 domain-containing protein n=1 Tax=Actinoallomurus purpureus TaxID=478114 RepID=UPI0020924C05|nr:DUF2795 domain-containing protein [Actinoallomurus purpureus]MCO6010605.1 DUF2795 domain-containing protein [Actinoallomurus purpureus]